MFIQYLLPLEFTDMCIKSVWCGTRPLSLLPQLLLCLSPFCQSSRCVKYDVRPSYCSSIMIFLVELSITQQALMHHESAIRSTDNCIFLLWNKVVRPVGINLNGDSDWWNERMVPCQARHWCMVACLPLTLSESESLFLVVEIFRNWVSCSLRLLQTTEKVI